jgi:hypothetical protein
VARYGGYPNIPWKEWDEAMDRHKVDLRAWQKGEYAS